MKAMSRRDLVACELVVAFAHHLLVNLGSRD